MSALGDAVRAAIGGWEWLERPPTGVLLTDRCQRRHVLGRVIRTTLGPVWLCHAEQAPHRDQLSHARGRGHRLDQGRSWRYEPVTQFSRHLPRCRCGSPPTGAAYTYDLPAGLPITGDGPTTYLIITGGELLAEIAAGTWERTIGPTGVLRRRAR